ncbi:permease prefix domain 1-containing protein [Paenibacillus amylolyticus]|uniref:permease prefix domain 1-containing protein n=1 Tax=Paenibacillus amylolyticus TaxID=1451 RepID=UPI003D2E0EE4
MKKIETFLDNLYRDSGLSKQELHEMREEMRTHLVDYIQDGRAKGLSEEQATIDAFEQFGGNQDIFYDNPEIKSKRRKWNVYWKISLFCFGFVILLLLTIWGGQQFYANERASFYNALWAELYRSETPDVAKIKSITENEIERGYIKDTVITEKGGSKSNQIFKTIDHEGFPQYDNWLIHTKVELKYTAHPNSTNVYEVQFSHNVVRYSMVVIISLLMSSFSIFFFIMGWMRYRKKGDY